MTHQIRTLIITIVIAGSVSMPAPSRAAGQAWTAADADLWTAAIAQLRGVEFSQRGDLVVLSETMPSRDFHALPSSTREAVLVDSLVRRNTGWLGVLADIQLPPNSRLRARELIRKPLPQGRSFFDDVNWESFSREFPQGRLLRLSLPAFSEDGTRAPRALT